MHNRGQKGRELGHVTCRICVGLPLCISETADITVYKNFKFGVPIDYTEFYL